VGATAGWVRWGCSSPTSPRPAPRPRAQPGARSLTRKIGLGERQPRQASNALTTLSMNTRTRMGFPRPAFPTRQSMHESQRRAIYRRDVERYRDLALRLAEEGK
jgi:hypothetical protein